MRKTLLCSAVLLALPLALCARASAAVDRGKIIEHVRRKFSTPNSYTLKIGDLKPAALAGYLKGSITIEAKGSKSVRDIHISEDGRYYFLAPLFDVRPSGFPGLQIVTAAKDQPAPPPIYLSPDGKHLFLGNGTGAPQDSLIEPDEANRDKISLKGVHAAGPANAPVTMVEYSDMQCPYCKMAHDLLDEKLKQAYGDKVRRIFKHYPLRNIHPWAHDAAVAVSCAGMQSGDGYHALISGFFREQKQITPQNLRGKALGFAAEAKLKIEPYTLCLDKKESAKLVEADIAEGDRLQVESTPSIFINGRKLLNALDFQAISEIIDEKLAERKAP